MHVQQVEHVVDDVCEVNLSVCECECVDSLSQQWKISITTRLIRSFLKDLFYSK